MRAIVVTEFGKPDVMKMIEMDVPKISPHQVLIKVKRTSINFADIKSRYGKKETGTFPYVPGLDVAGVIVELGSGVKQLKVGQRVIAFPSNGSYSEFVTANENLTFVLPDNVGFDAAAASPIVSFLSYNLLADVARIDPGETVLVHSAAGGVGTTAIQMAKILGAGTVIGTVSVDSKKEVAFDAGADYVISYMDNDFANQVNELTDGKGANIILDSVAGSVSERSLDCLAPFGRLVHFGNSSGQVGSFHTKDLHSSCRSVLGYSFGTTRREKPERLQETAKSVLGFIADGKLEVIVGHRFLLEEAVQAHELIESKMSVGKILLDVDL